MRTITRNLHKLARSARVALLALILVSILTLGGAARTTAPVTAQGGVPNHGMVCTTSPTATFDLTTQTGYIVIPDGNAVFMWGLSVTGGPFQHPNPVLCVNEGETVTITIHNNLPEAISLIFPGQENVLADGALSQPVFSGTDMVSLAPVAAATGGTMTYSFVATRPGTFLYESGTEPTKQIDMGLFGVLVVRPTNLAGLPTTDPHTGQPIAYAYNDAGSAYNPTTEYLLIMSEIDPMLHIAVEQGYLYNMNEYHPRYWLYNGRAFPDTVAENYAVWLPDQPYGSLVYIHPLDTDPASSGYNPYPALIRNVNAGMMTYSHHPHGSHGRLIAWDGHLLKSATDVDMSYEKFTITLTPGQTMDSLFQWIDVEHWHPIDNPVPVVIPQLQDLAVGQFYGGSPYLGNTENLPVGTQVLNQCGEYYHIAHNHALHQITAWGIVLSGHITFTRIDPPLPNECP